jgi:hypothetical protein
MTKLDGLIKAKAFPQEKEVDAIFLLMENELLRNTFIVVQNPATRAQLLLQKL